MANFLTSQECGPSCQEAAEFSIKVIITNFQLTDKDNSQGFDDILLVITFDGNVFKIDDFIEDDEGEVKPNGRELVFQQSPEEFSEKLGSVPIMFDLSRACDELGSAKMDISKCFVDAIKCEEFSSETITDDLSFVNKGNENNATMTVVLQVVRTVGDTAKLTQSLFKGYKKKSSDAKKTPAKKKTTDGKAVNVKEGDEDVDENLSCLTDDVTSSLDCDTDLCPTDDQSPSTFSNSLSLKSKAMRCCSDIAESIEFDNFYIKQKTFCGCCGGFSMSGITCDSPECSPCKADVETTTTTLTNKSPSTRTVASSLKCGASMKRICSECFGDLSVIPGNGRCPTCSQRERLQRKLVSLKSPKAKERESSDIRNCIKSMFEEIFLETKSKLMNDWKRLNRNEKTRTSKCGKQSSFRRKSNELHVKSMPRCAKLKKPLKKRRRNKHKLAGLRKKHPGVILGHKLCQGSSLLVPKNMGWLWNVGISGLPTFRRGWRPGAVKKPVARIMKFYLTPPAEPVPLKPKADPPTLRVQKKDGEYTIIMNPLRDELNGIEDSSPIVFKVVKSDDAKKRSMARKMLKTRGVEKSCDCNDIDKCPCLTTCDKAHILFELQEISTRLCLEPELNFCDLKDSSESEIDVEFSPTSAAKPKNFKCRPVEKSFAGTQYEIQEEAFSYHDNEQKEERSFERDEKAVKAKIKAGKEGEVKSKARPKATRLKSGAQNMPETSTISEAKSDTLHDSEARPRRKKQVVMMMKDLPEPEGCCNRRVQRNCNSTCQPDVNYCFPTNNNPMYGQYPPQPPVCGNSRYMPVGMFHQTFYV